jgi:phosphoribosylamine--glycine ligase
VPTARYEAFADAAAAVEYLKTMPTPYVIKTDGLAAGKGVFVTDSLADAEADVRAKLSGETFAGAGSTVVIEEGMTGPELSVLAVCDGTDAVLLPAAQDFKRAFDNDEGPNTGGMGAYSPVPGVDVEALDIKGRFIEPTLNALRKRDIDYRGVLYAGLMLTDDGPKLVEFNVRFGDPEAEAVLPLLRDDLTDLLARAADGSAPRSVGAPAGAAVTVMAAGDKEGAAIRGLDAAAAVEGVTVFHARTRRDDRGDVVAAGTGRILGVTGVAPSLSEARERAYAGIAQISFTGMQYRSDIAKKAVEGT